MQPVFDSAFLQSLGYAIANSIWQAALLWLLYALCTGLFQFNAKQKYRLGVVAQLVSFIWFVATAGYFISSYTPDQVSVLQHNENLLATSVPKQTVTSLLLWAWLKFEMVLPYLSVAYLLLIVVMTALWITGYRKAHTLRRTGLSEMPEEWHSFVQRISQQLGIQRKIGIFLSEKINTPATLGFLKPIILVPIASINHLTTAQLEAIILHELAHIKRYDYLINLALSVIEIALFFNPFTRLLSKSIKKERENCCDDFVLQFRYNVSAYADALLKIAQLTQKPVFALAAKGENKTELLGRVKRMIGQPEHSFNYKKQLLALLFVTTILSSIAWLDPAKKTPHAEVKQPLLTKVSNNKVPATVPTQKTVQPITKTLQRVERKNALFNPAYLLSDALQKQVEQELKLAGTEVEKELASSEFTRQLDKAINIKSEKIASLQKEVQDIETKMMPAFKAMNLFSTEKWAALDSSLKINFKNIMPDVEQQIAHAFRQTKKTDVDLLKLKAQLRKSNELTKRSTDRILINDIENCRRLR